MIAFNRLVPGSRSVVDPLVSSLRSPGSWNLQWQFKWRCNLVSHWNLIPSSLYVVKYAWFDVLCPILGWGRHQCLHLGQFVRWAWPDFRGTGRIDALHKFTADEQPKHAPIPCVNTMLTNVGNYLCLFESSLGCGLSIFFLWLLFINSPDTCLTSGRELPFLSLAYTNLVVIIHWDRERSDQ